MKKILISLLLLSLFSAADAQKYLDRFFDKYKHDNTATSFAAGKPALWLAASFSGDKDAAHWLNKISSVRLLAFDNQTVTIPNDEIFALIHKLQRDHFDDLVNVRSGTDNVKVMAKDDGQYIRNVVVIVKDDDDFVLVHLTGKLSYDDLNKIQSAIHDNKGKDHLSFTANE